MLTVKRTTFLISAVLFQVFYLLVQAEGFGMQIYLFPCEATLYVLIQIIIYATNKYLIVS